MQRKLYRSRSDIILGGVCAGLGQYFDVDPTVVRVVFVLLGLSGHGLLLYLVLWLIVPPEPLAQATA